MNATEILNIRTRYSTDLSYSYVAASFDLVAAGCNSLETSMILLSVETDRQKLEVSSRPVTTVDVVFRLGELAGMSHEEIAAELESPDWKPRPDNCVCSDQSYEVYGCTCQVRRMPGY